MKKSAKIALVIVGLASLPTIAGCGVDEERQSYYRTRQDCLADNPGNPGACGGTPVYHGGTYVYMGPRYIYSGGSYYSPSGVVMSAPTRSVTNVTISTSKSFAGIGGARGGFGGTASASAGS